MKKRNIQILIILIALGISLVFSSVGNAMDIDERTLVHAIGIDFKDGKYDVSMQVFKTGGSGSDTPIDVSQSNMCVVKSSGKTVSEALDIAQNELGREIFMGHLQLIVFGKTVDFSKPEDLFAFCLKDKNIYLGVKLCMADKTAEEIMSTEISRGTMTAESFTQTVEMNVKNGTTIDCELLDFLGCINSPQNIAMPILAVKEEKSDDSSGGSSGGQGGEEKNKPDPLMEIKGTALIVGGKVLDDTLNHQEAQGAAWLTQQAKSSDLTFKHGEETLTARLTDDGSKVWLSNENGKVIYNAKITIVAHIAKDINTKEESGQTSKEIKKELEKMYKSAEDKAFYKNSADIFGIWRLLRHSYPKSYLEYANRLDEIYKVVEFRTQTNVRIE